MSELTHFDASGQAHMVDVGGKAVTDRIAVAACYIRMLPETFLIITEGRAVVGSATKEIMQNILDDYRTGINVVQVNMDEAQPPEEEDPEGDAVTAAYALRQQGIVVHLIGFGLGSSADQDAASG